METKQCCTQRKQGLFCPLLYFSRVSSSFLFQHCSPWLFAVDLMMLQYLSISASGSCRHWFPAVSLNLLSWLYTLNRTREKASLDNYLLLMLYGPFHKSECCISNFLLCILNLSTYIVSYTNNILLNSVAKTPCTDLGYRIYSITGVRYISH